METEVKTPAPTPHPAASPRPGLGMIVGISLLVGSVSGGLVGAVVSQGGLSGWLKNSNSSASSVLTGTVTVEEDSATIDVVKKVSPAVVSIVAKKDFSKVFGNQSDPLNDFFGWPFTQPQPQGVQPVGSGSGFIITKDGMILTNKHVAEIQGDEFVVVMNDGQTYDAKVVATDPSTDIAFMKIDGRDLPTVEFGNSDVVEIGQTVIAIGNVLGKYQNSVTKGIVSGLARSITAGDGQGNSETLRNVIQTDAAINHGNSGGPLLNIAGQVIGINTAVDSSGQLVGFSIPINIAKKDLESVQATGKIERPYLGVRYVLVNDQVKTANELTVDYGALIARGDTRSEVAVIPGSPADKAGLIENDIVLEIDGQKITEENDLAQALIEKRIGDTVKLKILSKGNEKIVEIKLESRPAS